MVELSYITNFENDVTGTLSTLKNDSNNDGDINNKNNNNNNNDDVVVLFLHGLDSSSRTWRGVMQIDDNDDDDSKNYDPITFKKKMKMVALDLRGCGLSPLGNHTDFNIDTVVEDIKYFVDGVLTNIVTKYNLPPKLVLVGHSMGGRIAMHYANKYGDKDVKALVIEDMDVRHRSMKENPVIGKVGRDATLSFDRNNSTRFRTLEGLLDTFAEEGYERKSVERWIDDGRIRWISSDDDIDSDSTGERNGNSGGGGYFHSEVNPAFRLLCYETFCDIPNGCEDVWASIATTTTNNNNTMKKERILFPCHLMVAGERKKNSKNPYHGTICDENSVEWMRKIMNGDDDYENDEDREKPVQTNGGRCSDNSGRGGRLTIRRYPAAGHSIHNSDRRRFMCDLRNIYIEALAS